MKKTNKILARALVIILSLVLITSSVVSSTFAKYVVRKSAETTVKLQKFGLTVELDHNNKLTEKAETEVKGDSVTYKLNDVTLIPGNTDYLNALTASISGKSSVPATFSISIDITCNDTRFTLSNENFTKLSEVQDADKVYNPIAFYVQGDTTNPVNAVYSPLATSTSKNSLETNVENTIANKIKTKVDTVNALTSTSVSGGTISGEITQDVQFSLDNIGIGFMWTDTSTNTNIAAYMDEITTWISSSSAMTSTETTQFTISYTISVEQKTN